jgi:metacaspase-1
VRVVICSDSCHSGTVDRGDPPDDDLPAAKQLPMSVAIATEKAHQAEYDELQKKVPKERLAAMAATVVLLSGCQDHQFSRDGRANGAFTGALLKAWKEPAARKSLQALLNATAAGIPKDYDQVPNFTVLGFDIGPALTI